MQSRPRRAKIFEGVELEYGSLILPEREMQKSLPSWRRHSLGLQRKSQVFEMWRRDGGRDKERYIGVCQEIRRKIGSVSENNGNLKEVAVAYTRIAALDHFEKPFRLIGDDIKAIICLK